MIFKILTLDLILYLIRQHFDKFLCFEINRTSLTFRILSTKLVILIKLIVCEF